MTVPHVAAGQVAEAAAQNQLIDTVNTHTTSLDDTTANLDDLDSRVATLETEPSGGLPAGYYYGSWIDPNNGTGQVVTTGTGSKITAWTNPQGSVTGCSMSNGTLTVDQSGLWLIMVTTQYTAGVSVRAIWIANSANSNGAGTVKTGSVAGPSMDVQSTSAVFRLSAGDPISVYGAIWQNGSNVNILRAASNSLTAVWLGP